MNNNHRLRLDFTSWTFVGGVFLVGVFILALQKEGDVIDCA